MVVRTVAGCYQHLCGADSDSGCGAEPACVPNESEKFVTMSVELYVDNSKRSMHVCMP